MTPLERFMAKVDKRAPGDCWLWTGAHVPNGYGSFSHPTVAASQVGAHRWAYQHFKGEIPEGMCVMHLCDVKDCVNPAHLRLGTIQENSREAGQHGLMQSGDAHYMRRRSTLMSRNRADEIRARHAAGTPQRALASEYGVSQPLISMIVTRQRWS